MERRTPRKTGQSTALPATARPETAQSETAQSESNPSQSSRPLKSGRKKTKKLSARSKSARSIAAASASHIAAAADTDDSAASSSAIASLAGGTSHCHSLSNSDLIDKGLPLLAVHSLRGDAEALLKEGLACDGAQLRLVRDLYDCSAEHNVFAWVRVHEAAREGFGLQLTDDYDNSGGISLQGDGRGRLPPRLFSTVIDVQGGLALNLDQVQLIQLLFDGSRRVTLTRLPTVPSTRLQRLQVVSIDGAGNQQSAIILLDIAASLTSELENVRRVTELAGAEYVKIPHPPQYLDQQRRLLTESSSRTDDVGAVIMQLPGACWTTPELSGQVALSTVQRMLQRVLQESGDRNESELSVITELWTKDGQLHALATRTATRADRAAAESGGFLEQQLRRIAHQLTVTFVPVDLSEAGDYQPPKKLRECLARLEAAQRLQMNQVSGRSAFAESFVRQCLSEVWSDCSMVIMLLDRLQALLAAPSNWLSSWRPLLTYQHGNLCTANALIDSLGSVLLVDWSRSAMGNPFNDVAKIVVTTLLEHHSITLDEIRSAGAERLQRILGIERSAAERLFERATSCQTKDQLAHALDGDKALAPALARLNDEFGARQTLSQVTRLFESLLEPVDGKPPQLVHIASRKLPAWATSRAQQYLHRIIVSVIRAAMGLVSTCSRRGTEGSDESSAKALAASDLHVAHLLFPVLEMCLTASCEVLSVWQKRLAWEMAQQCSRTLSIALQHEPVALPSDATFEPASYSTLRLALGPVLLRKAIASCLTGGQGTMHGAILVQDGDQVIVPLATVGKLHILLGNASGLASADRNGKSDPYVVFSCATNKAMSTVKPKTLDPTWNETIVMDGILHDLIDSGLTLKVFDSDGAPKPEKDDCIGQKPVALDCLRRENPSQFIESLNAGSANGVGKGKIVFAVTWEPPPSSPPISSGGIPNPAAVPQLHEWLRGAHASRTKIPSTMLRLHRLVSQGMPDEISVRLQREFGDLARGFSAQKRDATCLHAAADELALAKSTFASLWERLLSKTRAELDEYISIEKQKEETVKQRQQKELQVLLDSNQGEMDAIVSEQQHALAKLDREQYVVRQDLSVKEILTKKKQSEETDAELKIFKDGQYRDKAAQQLSQQQRRADGEQQLSADKDADMNACQERRLSETRMLQEEQQKEIGQFQATSKHEAMLRAAQYQSIEDNLSKEQASNHKEFDAVQAKERADFDAEMTLRMTNFQKAWDAKEAEQKQKLEDERHRRFNENRDHKKRLTDNQTEERTQLLARQKVAMKDLVERHQEAKAALAVKQEEDRKADFARRRQRMEEEAKAKEAKAKEAKANKGKNMNTAKEADTKVVVPAPAVEEVPEEKKIPPAKEKTMLETALKEEREALTNAHDLEVTTLTSEQKVRMQAFEAEQEAQLAALMEVQAAARKALLAKKEVEAQQMKNSGEEERARLEKKLEAQAADLQKSHEAARRKIAEQRAKDEEEALMKQQDAAKRLDKRLQVAKDALKQEHHELQNSITEKHEELRRQFIQAQDDEMAIFTQKQDDARKEVVGVHKAAEKQLDEKLKAERKVVDDQLDEERATFMAKHANVRNILAQEHNQKRGVLESKHFIERKDLVSEQQRARTVFIAQQQIAKDQHVIDFRTRLYQIVENAQNEFNLAAIRNACILVTGGPASGKTTTIRQLLAHVLRVIQREQEFQLVPILICVPDLKDNLLRDREKIARVQSKHKFERIELDARHEAERVALASRTTPEAAIAKELVDDRQAEESKHLETEQDNELQEAAWRQSKFARSWNWVDAHLQCVYGPKSGTYTMLRQALLSRRALLLIDGLDEGGPVSEEIQRHITEVLAPQGHTMVVTSRTEGLRLDWFSVHFEHMSLRPLSDALQAQLVELRLGANPSCVQKLLKYIRTQVPLDNKGQRETCSPLNISLMIAIFDNLGDVPVPDSITSLYEIASKILLERSLGGASHGVASAAALALITPLLEAIFFRAHAMHMREIEMYHVEAAALALGAPDQLAAVEWPPYKGRVRVGQVVKLLRGESAGRVGLLTSDSRGKLINGHTPRSPFRITFFDQTLSPWVKTGDFISSGLEHAPYNTKMGVDGQRKAIRLAFDKLPEAFHQAVHAVCTWVLTDQMPMLSLLQSEPLKMQASFPFLQEFFSARALCKGRALPGEPPWRWSAWWSNTLRLGSEMGKSFGSGLVRSTCSGLKLDLAGQVAGHRPTSIAAISQLMLGVMSMDLSQNCITIEELKILAKALQNSATLLELSLSKNSLGDEGAAILSAHIAESKLMSLNLFGSGIKEEGAKALASVISSSTSLTHLNLQYNAVRGETKKMLEAANAARVPQLVLVL